MDCSRLPDNSLSATSSVHSVFRGVKPPERRKPHRCPKTTRQAAEKGRNFGHFCSDFAPSASLRAVIHSLATHGGARLRLLKHLGAQVFGGEIGLILPRDGVYNGRQVEPLELSYVAQGREYRASQGIRQVDDAPLARTEAYLEFIPFNVLGLYYF
jgi:hypothetical protein